MGSTVSVFTLVCSFLPLKPVNKLPFGSRDSYVIGLSFLSGSCATYAVKAAFANSHSKVKRKPALAVCTSTLQWKGRVEGSELDLGRVQNILAQPRVKLHANRRIE